MRNTLHKRYGFTLLEVIAVIVIVSIIATSIVSNIPNTSSNTTETAYNNNKTLFDTTIRELEKLCNTPSNSNSTSLAYSVYNKAKVNKSMVDLINPYNKNGKGVGINMSSNPTLGTSYAAYILISEPVSVPKGVLYYVIDKTSIPTDPFITDIPTMLPIDDITLNDGIFKEENTIPPPGQTEVPTIVTDGYAEIWYVEQLVNIDSAPTGAVKLMRDLDFNDAKFYVNSTNLSKYKTAYPSSQTMSKLLNGNHKTVSISIPYPLFYTINGVVHDLNILSTNPNKKSILTNYLNNSTILNVNITGDIDYNGSVASLASESNGTNNITNVNILGNLKGSSAASLINSDHSYATNLGKLSIYNCTYNGTLSGTVTGGLVCGIYGDDTTSPSVTIYNSHVKANLTGTYAGGLVANAHSVSIYNSSYTGTITSSKIAGGLVYGTGANPDASYSYSNTYVTVNNCTVNTTINLTVADNVYSYTGAGGIAGYAMSNTTIEKCNVVADINVTGNAKAASGMLAYTDTVQSFRNSTVSVNIKAPKTLTVGGVIGFAGLLKNMMDNTVKDSNIVGSYETGGLLGYVNTRSNIYSCYVLNSTVQGTQYVGGIVAYADSASAYSVYRSAFTGKIISTKNPNPSYLEGNEMVGGITGYSDYDISQSYAIADIVSEAHVIRGLGNTNEITNSYFIGSIKSTSPSRLLGSSSINGNKTALNCYSYLTSAPQTTYLTTQHSPSNTSTYGYSDTPVTKGPANLVTKDQLALKSTFSGWDFSSVWTFDTSISPYPILRNNIQKN